MEPTKTDESLALNMTVEANNAVLESSGKYLSIPLKKDPNYIPTYPHLPISEVMYEVELDSELSEAFERVRNSDLYGDDNDAAARDLVMDWVGTKVDW